jgi:hypothetical protein
MPAPRNAAKDFVLRSEERIAVRSLSGFKPGVHHLPKVLDRRAEDWVAEIAQAELEADLARTHESLRASMSYTRKQVEVIPSREGFGSIRTPDFQYTISVTLDEDVARAVFTREVSEIRHPDILADPGFATVFDNTFDSIRLLFGRRIDVEDLIDKAEAKQVPVDYPHDCSTCRFKVSDRGIISVTQHHLALTYPSGKPVSQLMTALREALRMLPKAHGPKSLPRPAKGQLE